MPQYQGQRTKHFSLGFWGTILATIAIPLHPAVAQLIPDRTLGAESSQVAPLDRFQDRIDGGAVQGANLFHSFLEFNVGEGRGVYFANPIGIENILTRITGGNPSDILGTLGVLGSGNLFLLNPSGIYFGPNARLDVSGSFLATTGDRIQLGSQGYFSATDLPGSQLLAVKPEALFANALRNHQAEINNHGNLRVGAGQTLTLFGATVRSRGSLTAPGGTVQILGDRVGLFDSATIDVSSPTGGGTVLVGGDYQGKGNIPTARQTLVDSGVTINADTFNSGDGGTVIVWSDGTTRFWGNISARGGANSGNGGFVEVSGLESLDFQGNVDAIAPNGNPGTLLLDPTDFIVNAGNVGAINNAGANVTLQADRDVIFDAAIAMTTPGVGLTAQAGNDITVNQSISTQGGDVTLRAGRDISFTPGASIDATGVLGGTVTLESTGKVLISGFAAADTNPLSGITSFSLGPAPGQKGGDINLIAESIVLQDIAIVAVDTTGDVDGGDINIKTQSLNLTGGAEILARTFSSGRAGNLTVEPLDPNSPSSVTISGVVPFIGLVPDGNGDFTPQGGFSSGLFVSNENPNVMGQGGKMAVTTDVLRLLDGGVLSARNRSLGQGGDIVVNADTIEITGGAQILAPTFFGAPAGKIEVNARSNIRISGFDPNWFDQFNRIQQAYINVGFPPDVAFARARFTVDPVAPFSGLRATVEPEAVASFDNFNVGGDIVVNTGWSLILDDRAQIAVGTFGLGGAGNIFVDAKDAVVLRGGSSIRGDVERGGIGLGGDIGVRTSSLLLTEGSQISTGVFPSVGDVGGIGIGGNLAIVADIIRISGVGTTGAPSGFFANTEEGSFGNAGNIFVGADLLFLEDGGTISVGGRGVGEPGNIGIVANGIILNETSKIEALSLFGSSANINLDVGVAVLSRFASDISAIAFNNGGNITINAGAAVLAVQPENSDIVAASVIGQGGRIALKAPLFRGFQRLVRGLTPDSDIDSSSVFGVDGDESVEEGTGNFPRVPIDRLDVESLNQDICALRDGKIAGGSSFVVTGRGGLPPNPTEMLIPGTEAVEWSSQEGDVFSQQSSVISQQMGRHRISRRGRFSESPFGTHDDLSTKPAPSLEQNENLSTEPAPRPVVVRSRTEPREIRQAQGWVKARDGTVILTAEGPPAAYSSGFNHPYCDYRGQE